jgi:hypothetical protein
MEVATNPSPAWQQREATMATTAALAVMVLATALVVDREEVV